MSAENLALVRGVADTRSALRRWNSGRAAVLRPWLALSLLIAILLLCAIWAVAALTVPDSTRLRIMGITAPADLRDYGHVLFKNSLVLALHSLACVAGFIAGSSLPVVAAGHRGLWRRVHQVAGPLAIGFVVCATAFSLVTQAYILGGDTATIAAQLGIAPEQLLGVLALHALPELTALFLPLAAWTIASRRGAWHELLAATFVTTAIAIPVLLVAGAVEVWVTPRLLLGVL